MTTTPQTTQPKRRTIAAKLAEIVTEVHRVEKRGLNEHFNYNYARAEDVLEAVRTALASRNLTILPRITGTEVVTKERQGKSPEFITTVKQTFAILDGDSDEVLEVPWAGCGQDSGDKGLYKALTGGYKYFLLQLFMIPTGDDPEKDTRKPKGERQRESDPTAPVSADAAAILMLAAELADQSKGKDKAENIIRAASTFKSKKDGRTVSGFTDPRGKTSEAWLKETRRKLEEQLHGTLKDEPGVAEAAEIFK